MPRRGPGGLPSYGDLTARSGAVRGDPASQLDGDIARMLGGLETRVEALEKRATDKWTLSAHVRVGESDEEAIARTAAEEGIPLDQLAAATLWYTQAHLHGPTDLPIARDVDFLPHDGIETLKGYVSLEDTIRWLDENSERDASIGCGDPDMI